MGLSIRPGVCLWPGVNRCRSIFTRTMSTGSPGMVRAGFSTLVRARTLPGLLLLMSSAGFAGSCGPCSWALWPRSAT